MVDVALSANAVDSGAVAARAKALSRRWTPSRVQQVERIEEDAAIGAPVA